MQLNEKPEKKKEKKKKETNEKSSLKTSKKKKNQLSVSGKLLYIKIPLFFFK